LGLVPLTTALLALVRGPDVSWTDQLELVGLVAVAVLLGSLIGAERELANKSAGLRTHALVAAGAAVAVAIGHALYETAINDGVTAGDPGRALHAVLTGIGFIGAGAIIRQSSTSVEGLTTAASLWFAAAVGIATGMGLLVLAAGTTIVGLLVLSLMRVVDGALRGLLNRSDGDPGATQAVTPPGED
jgi:putative Mg2+ transporter-C (MgtC) family protein